MVYTNNVPQGNQQIATTQPLIQANFGFLESAIDQEHNFDASDPTLTYHLQASMPNLSGGDPSMLPAGTNGLYYVLGGVPKFYNTSANFIQLTKMPYKILTGTQALTASATNVSLIPANSVGQYFMFIKSGNNLVTTQSATGTFVSDSNSLYATDIAGATPGLIITSSGLALRAAVNNSGLAGTYTYFLIYYNP